MLDVRLVPTADEYVERFNAAVDIVARERRYLALLEGPPIDATRQFVQRIVNGGGVQQLAVTPAGAVVGWCDIVRIPFDGFRHVGRLGMGVLSHYRGRGLGRRLAVETIRAARRDGIERIELEVFASNTVALALYERLGFVTEGVRRRARKLDGQYDDNVIMALIDEDGRAA
jgi:RimJ/RimL family protein N-acetyltransferase